MTPTWLTLLLVAFLVVALRRPRMGRSPVFHVIVAIGLALAYTAVNKHVL